MSAFVTGIDLYGYNVPLKSTFVWARGTVATATNVVAIIRGEASGRPITGIGESAPRGPALTGDIWRGVSHALQHAGNRLLNSEIPTGDSAASLAWIAKFMSSLKPPLPGSAPEGFKAYRGSLCGVEMALLDLAAKARGLTVAQLLGVERDEIRVSAKTIADDSTPAELTEQFKTLGDRFPIRRMKGVGESGDRDLDRLTSIADIDRKLGLSRRLWIDINGNFSADTARSFVARVAERAKSERLPREIIIEQPVIKGDLQGLADLQDYADQKASAYGGEIVIMADDSVWDSDDVEKLLETGGCRALNIKMQKAGGLLESLRAARLFAADDADRRIQFGGFPGAGDVTAWGSINLCMALPRLDFFTPAPPLDVDIRFGNPRCAFAADDSNLLMSPTGPGLGVDIDMGTLRPLVHTQYRIPEDLGPQISASWG